MESLSRALDAIETARVLLMDVRPTEVTAAGGVCVKLALGDLAQEVGHLLDSIAICGALRDIATVAAYADVPVGLLPVSALGCVVCKRGQHERCDHRHGARVLRSTSQLGCQPTASYCCCEPDPSCERCGGRVHGEVERADHATV